MPQANLTKGHRAIDSLAAEGVILPGELPFDLLQRPGNKTTRLVAVSGASEPVKSQHRWYDYEFKKYAFVIRIEIEVSGFSDQSEFEVKYKNVFGSEVNLKSNVRSGKAVFIVNDIVTLFSFRPPRFIIFDKYIINIRLIGIVEADVDLFLSSIEKVDAYKEQALEVAREALSNAQAENDRYVELQSQLTNLANEIKKVNGDLSSKRSELTKLNARVTSLKGEKVALDDVLKNAGARLAKTNAENDLRVKAKENLDNEILDREMKLKSLKEDVNMFPSEISGFFGQGNRTMVLYASLSAVPMAIIFAIFIMLMAGAADLTTIFQKMPNYSVYSILITRIPYVAISVAILTICYKIASVLLGEVIRINHQKLSLTKISIIAKDVSIASEQNLNLSDDEIYELRTKLKMELLREHLKDYLSKDFQLSFLGRQNFGVGKISSENDLDIKADQSAPK